MSAAMVVPGVSAALRDMLALALVDQGIDAILGGGSQVRLQAPPAAPDVHETTAPTLSLFLYRIAENAAMRNLEPRSRGGDVRAAHLPPLTLDLHYLITSAAGTPSHAEALLGAALVAIHSAPLLPASALQTAVRDATGSSAASVPAVSPRIMLTTLQHDEMARLWSALGSPLRAAVTCQVTVAVREPERA